MANFQKIRDLMHTKKMQQKDLCETVGITGKTFIDLVNRNSTKTEILERIAKALDTPVGYFFDEEPTKKVEVQKKEENAPIYKKLVEAQEELLKNKDKEISNLKKEVESLKNELRLPSGYGLVAEPHGKLKK